MRQKWFFVVWIFVALVARAEGPDDTYIQIYNSLQQADTYNQNGQFRPAAEKYSEVKAALENFQKSYPTWNPRIIRFRQNYVTERLQSLANFLPRTAVAVQPKTAVQTAPPSGAEAEQIQALNEKIQRLEAERSNLEAKLREALSVKPATESSAAAEQITKLEKERDLLKATVEQLQSIQAVQALARSNPEDAKRIRELEAERDDLKRQLITQESRHQNEIKQAQAKFRELEQLNNDRALLEKKLREALQLATEAHGGKISKDDAKKIKKLEEEKTDLLEKFEKAEKELVTMQTEREQRIRSHQSAIDRIKELEKQRDDLEKRAKQVVTTAPRSQDNNLTEENQKLRSRLEAYEARPAPFTQEELALFKKPEGATLPKSFVVASKMTKELPSKAKALVAEADRDFAARRFDKAEEKYQQVLSQSGTNVYALANLASTQIERGRMAEAELNLKKALEADSNDAFSLLLMGKLKMGQNKFDEALDALSHSAQANPNSAETQNYLGIVLSEKGQRVSAEAALRKAIQIQPDYASAHHNLAIIYATQKPPFLELAKWHYDKALALGHAKNGELEKLIAGQ